MGFTLAAALEVLGPKGQAVVRELVPAVVRWNEGVLGAVAGHPLKDPRSVIEVGDVGAAIRGKNKAWDSIMLDVDNSPRGLTRRKNDSLYSRPGLAATHKALRPGGVLSVWSAEQDNAFTARLKQVGFKVETRIVRAHGKKGSKHIIWLAQR
jgi:spermidine synthase